MSGLRYRGREKPPSEEIPEQCAPLKEKMTTPKFSQPTYLESTETFTSYYLTLLILSALGIATRFYRIALPPAVVFDELHFSKFVDRILTRTWFFDIHPPLGKLILAYTSYLFGYRPEPTFVIEKIGNEYPQHVKYVIVRSVAAAFSAASVPMTYIVARNLRISPVSSILAATSVLLDFLGVIEGRLILTDSQLFFFCQLALYCALRLWRTSPHTGQRKVWLVATGFASGAALSVKHTALATPGLIALISFFGIHFLTQPLDLSECLYAALCGFSVYMTSFYVMFQALWYTGGKYDRFMPLHFRRTLIDAKEYDPAAKRKPFLRLFSHLNIRMLRSNANITKRHTWESDWYQWIVNWRGVLYYLKKETVDDVEYRTQIYLFGNPVVIYLTLLCVVIFLIGMLTSVRYRKIVSRRPNFIRFQWIRSNGIFLLWGWLCNLLPYILVDRAAFMYHYLPGLFYGQLLTSAMFDLLPLTLRRIAVFCVMTIMTGAFVYWSPWIYAFPLINEQHVARRWLPKWT